MLWFTAFALAESNKAYPKMTGPNDVPNEFILPAKFNLNEPLAGSPKLITYGLATICNIENPNAMTNNPIRKNRY